MGLKASGPENDAGPPYTAELEGLDNRPGSANYMRSAKGHYALGAAYGAIGVVVGGGTALFVAGAEQLSVGAVPAIAFGATATATALYAGIKEARTGYQRQQLEKNIS